MSLQIWLPLTDDLHNQGLSEINVINNGATLDNNGKIGKCYSLASRPAALADLFSEAPTKDSAHK